MGPGHQKRDTEWNNNALSARSTVSSNLCVISPHNYPFPWTHWGQQRARPLIPVPPLRSSFFQKVFVSPFRVFQQLSSPPRDLWSPPSALFAHVDSQQLTGQGPYHADLFAWYFSLNGNKIVLSGGATEPKSSQWAARRLGLNWFDWLAASELRYLVSHELDKIVTAERHQVRTWRKEKCQRSERSKRRSTEWGNWRRETPSH